MVLLKPYIARYISATCFWITHYLLKFFFGFSMSKLLFETFQGKISSHLNCQKKLFSLTVFHDQKNTTSTRHFSEYILSLRPALLLLNFRNCIFSINSFDLEADFFKKNYFFRKIKVAHCIKSTGWLNKVWTYGLWRSKFPIFGSSGSCYF